jgi:TIR domain
MRATNARFDVFVSYSHTDAAWVWEWLRPRLEAAGLRLCLDRRDFDVGVPSLENMERAVDHSRHTLLVLTPAWVASEGTAFEQLLTQTADPAARHRRLLPLLLQPCQPPRRIAMLTYADFTRRNAWETELQRVIAAVQGELHLPEFGPPLREQLRQSREQRNRQAMLEKVRTIWIAGVLQRSLVHEVLIILDLAERPEAVAPPLDLLVQRPDGTERRLPPGTRLIDVFDTSDRALLILGAPGAGKTTLLLALAQELLTRAGQDADHPLPVVDALHEQYDIPRTIGQAWLEADEILPLLDGLDEVRPESRAACVEAINAFRQDHGLLPLVVCSRLADYEAVDRQLRLQGAIVVQPLTRPQIDAYLAQVGQPLAAVRDALQDDPTLWELLETPLMLTIVTLAYAGASVEVLRTQGTPAERRQHLFATYVDRMFQRRGASTRYAPEQSVHWLAWLAWHMVQHNQSVFYLERMQSDWLPHGQRWIPTTSVRIGFLIALLLLIVLDMMGFVVIVNPSGWRFALLS